MQPLTVHEQADQSVVRTLELRAHSSQLSVARRFTAAIAGAFGLEPARGAELVFAVNEAVTNAIRHGKPDAEGQIHITVLTEGNLLTFEVSDQGTFVAPAEEHHPMSEHGRGFDLMRRFADRVSLLAGPDGTAVRLSKELA
jgi:anti-sigma regulatory factor (Ser/Thr protein kinase)